MLSNLKVTYYITIQEKRKRNESSIFISKVYSKAKLPFESLVKHVSNYYPSIRKVTLN